MPDRIKIVEQKDDELIISIKVETCTNCGHAAIPRYTSIPTSWVSPLNDAGVRFLTYASWSSLCSVCIEEGGFQVECELCSVRKSFPGEFAYQLSYFGREDATYDYICKLCVRTRPQDVIDLMPQADMIETADEADYAE